jgi:hypothetical protein
MRAVREVEAKHVCPRAKQFLEHLERAACGTDCGDLFRVLAPARRAFVRRPIGDAVQLQPGLGARAQCRCTAGRAPGSPWLGGPVAGLQPVVQAARGGAGQWSKRDGKPRMR